MSPSVYFDESDTNITGLNVLMKEAENFEISLGNSVYFRGQPKASWGLTPSIKRTHWHAGKPLKVSLEKIEQALIQRFRRYSYLHEKRTLNEWDALFLARHHGLPVRLLDWTSSPLIALFFAAKFGEKPEEDGAVWGISRKGNEDP